MMLHYHDNTPLLIYFSILITCDWENVAEYAEKSYLSINVRSC